MMVVLNIFTLTIRFWIKSFFASIYLRGMLHVLRSKTQRWFGHLESKKKGHK